MKIIRFVSPDGSVHAGVIESPDDEAGLVLEGDLYGSFKVTNREVEISRLLPPIVPLNILAIGLNYEKHAQETGIRRPDIPIMFIKSTNSLCGPGEAIVLPAVGADQVDYEAELGVVIGKMGKNIPVEKAMDYVLGYTCANDVSARDWQIHKQKTQWARGKSFDTFCPIGPWLITRDEVPDPHNLWIKSEINGKVYQDSNTSDMIFKIPTIISNLSQSLTLYPGTLILTGTPNGVGFTRIPSVFLKPGDLVTITIDRVGRLSNPVIAELGNS